MPIAATTEAEGWILTSASRLVGSTWVTDCTQAAGEGLTCAAAMKGPEVVGEGGVQPRRRTQRYQGHQPDQAARTATQNPGHAEHRR
ncbi:MAG: hypothetical protein M3Y91_11190, partial [Actinomycetota bacterium]|nr:hypothetical protein [Actinomycetota bacterium]